jgi:hypothetical protein
MFRLTYQHSLHLPICITVAMPPEKKKRSSHFNNKAVGLDRGDRWRLGSHDDDVVLVSRPFRRARCGWRQMESTFLDSAVVSINVAFLVVGCWIFFHFQPLQLIQFSALSVVIGGQQKDVVGLTNFPLFLFGPSSFLAINCFWYFYKLENASNTKKEEHKHNLLLSLYSVVATDCHFDSAVVSIQVDFLVVGCWVLLSCAFCVWSFKLKDRIK